MQREPPPPTPPRPPPGDPAEQKPFSITVKMENKHGISPEKLNNCLQMFRNAVAADELQAMVRGLPKVPPSTHARKKHEISVCVCVRVFWSPLTCRSPLAGVSVLCVSVCPLAGVSVLCVSVCCVCVAGSPGEGDYSFVFDGRLFSTSGAKRCSCAHCAP